MGRKILFAVLGLGAAALVIAAVLSARRAPCCTASVTCGKDDDGDDRLLRIEPLS